LGSEEIARRPGRPAQRDDQRGGAGAQERRSACQAWNRTGGGNALAIRGVCKELRHSQQRAAEGIEFRGDLKSLSPLLSSSRRRGPIATTPWCLTPLSHIARTRRIGPPPARGRRGEVCAVLGGLTKVYICRLLSH